MNVTAFFTKVLVVFAFCFFIGISILQAQSNSPEQPDDTTQIHTIAERLPEYPGGREKFIQYVEANLKRSPLTKDSKCKLFVEFIVQTSGILSNVKVAKVVDGEVSPEVQKELERIITSSIKWKPGAMGAVATEIKVMNVKMYIPVKIGYSTWTK